MEKTGFSRSTVAQRLKELDEAGLIIDAGQSVSTGGRRRTVFKFNGSKGIVIAATLDWTTVRVAIVDLSGNVLSERELDHDISTGPTRTLEVLLEQANALRREISPQRQLWGLGVGLTGPVDFASGRALSPIGMTGWDGFPVADWLSEKYDCPALVDSDTNLMALGERLTSGTPSRDMVFVKSGTDIGASFILDGRVFRGDFGSAGNIGHICVPGLGNKLCACGNTGCLEAAASGRSLAVELAAEGLSTRNVHDVAVQAQNGSEAAIAAVRRAGNALGLVLANLVNALNLSVISLGGALTAAGDPFLAGVRETIYAHCPSHATRNLDISLSTSWRSAAIIGAAEMVVDRALAQRASNGHL